MPIISPADEESNISSNLNSSMLFNFLMVSKKSANMNRRIILSAISVLYLLCFFNFIFQWYILDWSVVINGDTRKSVFIATVEGPHWAFVLTVFLVYSLFIVSDGLLIWMCFNTWGQSFRIILVPLILVVVEFSTTVITSLLIGYKIHSTYRFHDRHFKRLFNHVVTVFIESSGAFSLMLVINAISIAWYILDWCFVINGDTRNTMFLSTIEGPQWTWALTDSLPSSSFLVSDGLLVCRYHIIDYRTKFINTLTDMVMLQNLGTIISSLFLAQRVFTVLNNRQTTPARATLFNNITRAFGFVSLGTTAITTLLIGYKIHSTYRFHDRHFKRLFNHLVIVFIESSAAYSLVLVIDAINVAVPLSQSLGSTLSQMQYYVDAILAIAAVSSCHHLSDNHVSSTLNAQSGDGSDGYGSKARACKPRRFPIATRERP
ncbi:hypothetical protein CVT25_015085 [Psilocybe cyanescens]|uniref:Uncharacterized protein n=1 Tax=Psilocybe cyanescens TaxID=93625 RepID=A0A409WS76_PSICY|nr:hypothetical protein CVT25_015085 [Psilocybe cyanescens]